jgi:hypothetical protein
MIVSVFYYKHSGIYIPIVIGYIVSGSAKEIGLKTLEEHLRNRVIPSTV